MLFFCCFCFSWLVPYGSRTWEIVLNSVRPSVRLSSNFVSPHGTGIKRFQILSWFFCSKIPIVHKGWMRCVKLYFQQNSRMPNGDQFNVILSVNKNILPPLKGRQFVIMIWLFEIEHSKFVMRKEIIFLQSSCDFIDVSACYHL